MVYAKKLMGLILSLSLIAGSLIIGSVAEATSSAPGDNCHIFAYEDFSDYNLDVGTNIEGKKNWAIELVNSGSRGTSFTLEDEPGNISNKTLLINHHTQYISSGANKNKVTSERFGQDFGSTVSGKIEFSFRIRPINATNFSFYIISGEGSTTATNGTLAKLDIASGLDAEKGRAYSSYFKTADATEITSKASGATYSFVANEWNSFYVAVDTENNTFEIKLVNSRITVEKTYTAYYPAKVGGFRMEIPRTAVVSSVYVDDLYAYADMSSELSQAAAYVNESLISNESLDSLTGNIFALPEFIGEDGTIGVQWSSSNSDAVNVETSVVTQRKYPQSCIISAKITLDAETEFVKNASTTMEFPVTVLPYGSFTDGEIIDDFLDSLNENILSNEPLDAITTNLKSLPLDGPDGMTLEWVSENQDYLKNDGSVIRPENGENETVKFTVKAIKGITEKEKSFYLTILFDLSAEKKVAEAKKELVASVITGERPEAVTKNLTLPQKGLYDTVIEWSSSNESVITSEGAVTRCDTDTRVVMTAHIIFGYAEDWTDIELTVKMSAQAMAEADSAQLSLAEGIVERSFSLPTLGSVYKSSITWQSNDSSIGISNGYAVVTQPDYENGDASVTLTAKITNENFTAQKEFHFTVKPAKADAELVNEVYSKLDSVLGHTTGDRIKDNLAFKTSFANGVKCSWEVSDSSIIESNGEVNNPGVGEDSVTVTVTATVYKNSANMEKEYIFTVLPFENEDEIIEKAAQMLSFSKISSDKISAVKTQLSLPKSWKYNTRIEWSSSDESLISIADDTDAKIGIVHRPAFGNGDGAVILTAKITYNGQERIKTFNISVKENVEYVTRLYMDNEAGALGETPVVPRGKLTLAENYSLTVGIDPEDDTNKVMRIFRAQADVKPTGTAYSRYAIGTEIDGHAIVTARLYIDENTENAVSFSVRSYLGAAITVTFGADRKMSYTTDNGVVLEGTGAPSYERGKWLNLKFDVNNASKKFHFYIDDVLMTQNGYLTDGGEPYYSKTGVKMIIYSNPQKPGNVYGFDITLGNSVTSHDSIVYLDDICVMQETEYAEGMAEVMEEFEIEFLSENNIYEIRKDIVIPTLINNDFKVKLYSENTEIVTPEGKVIRPQNDTDVVFTVAFSDGTYVAYRKYNLKVKAYDPGESTITGDTAQLLQSDLEKIITTIKTNYQLSSLSKNISLPKEGENGSVVAYTSSNDAVITADGVITRSDKNTYATLTVTVAIGNETLAEAIDITVRANNTVVSGGGGSGGSGVMIGKSTVKDTGISIPENKTEYFSDVPAQHWAYEYVAELYKKGIISRADNFRPSDSITRAELLKMIVCASETEIVYGENGDFTDVSVLDWYAPYIAAAKNMGIIEGRDNNTFAPNENISRQDAVVICYNAALAKNYILDKKEGVAFSDAAQISDYAKDAVEALAKSAVISGNNGAFFPINQLTRAEAAAIISRLIAYQ